LHELCAGHQLWKIDGPFMVRVIGTVVITELALVTEIDDVTPLLLTQLRRFLIMTVNRLEETWKRRAERKTATTVVTLLEDPRQLGIQ
jgi:hypothetical protein